MKGSLIIVGFFILGIICGLMHWLPDLNTYGNVSFLTLCALLFCVGMTVGNNTTLLKSFTKLDPRLMLLPLMTIVGTLAATAVASLGLPNRSLADCLAVGSGFGYYSLSSILITQYRGPDLGTVALLANIIREVFTLLGAPLLVRYFGPLSPYPSSRVAAARTSYCSRSFTASLSISPSPSWSPSSAPSNDFIKQHAYSNNLIFQTTFFYQTTLTTKKQPRQLFYNYLLFRLFIVVF